MITGDQWRSVCGRHLRPDRKLSNPLARKPLEGPIRSGRIKTSEGVSHHPREDPCQ
jgi:hypothetical protein